LHNHNKLAERRARKKKIFEKVLKVLCCFSFLKTFIKSLRASSRILEYNFSSLFTSIENFDSFTNSSSNQSDGLCTHQQQSSIQQRKAELTEDFDISL